MSKWTESPISQPRNVNIRLNQRFYINLLTGMAYNPGFGPVNAFDPSGVPKGFTGQVGNPVISKNPITSISIVVKPMNGDLIESNTFGLYQYTPYPRYHGRDSWIYTVIDSKGLKSENQGIVIINIVSLPQPGNNPRFIYSSNADVIQKNGSIENLLFKSTLSTTVYPMATNKDDSLIYWQTPYSSAKPKILAYDYITGQQWVLADLSDPSIGSLFVGYPNIIVGIAGSTYNKSIIYIPGQSSTNYGFWRVVVAPHAYGAQFQDIIGVSFVEYSDNIRRVNGDMSYDVNNDLLVYTGQSSGGVRVNLINPISGKVIFTHVLQSFSNAQNALGPDGIVYEAITGNRGGALNVNGIGIGFSPPTIPVPPFNFIDPPSFLSIKVIDEMTDWISQPVYLGDQP